MDCKECKRKSDKEFLELAELSLSNSMSDFFKIKDLENNIIFWKIVAGVNLISALLFAYIYYTK